MVQWSSALAAMTMLCARTWVRISLSKVKFFFCNEVSPLKKLQAEKKNELLTITMLVCYYTTCALINTYSVKLA